MLLLSLAACDVFFSERYKTTLKSIVNGHAIIRCRWPCDWGSGWIAFGSGIKVTEGDLIHAPDDGLNTVELRDFRSLLILQPDTFAVMEAISEDLQLTQTRLHLEEGGVYAQTDQSLGEGYLDVETPAGTVSLGDGSGMLVTYDPSSGIVRVACVQGKLTISPDREALILSAGEATAFTRQGIAQQVEYFEGQPPNAEESFWEALLASLEKQPTR